MDEKRLKELEAKGYQPLSAADCKELLAEVRRIQAEIAAMAEKYERIANDDLTQEPDRK